LTNSAEIRSELRGVHWIAWVARPGDGKPEGSIVLVGQTQAEAIERAKQWAAHREGQPVVDSR
jgi:hypothetical protein